MEGRLALASRRDDSKPWFAALLLVSSGGLLDALYLFVVSPRRRS